jgi:hypothetical protein
VAEEIELKETPVAEAAPPIKCSPSPVVAAGPEAAPADGRSVKSMEPPAGLVEPADAADYSWANTWAPEPAWSSFESTSQVEESTELAAFTSAAPADWIDEAPLEHREVPKEEAVALAEPAIAVTSCAAVETLETVTEPAAVVTAPVEQAVKRAVLPTSGGTLPSAGGSLPSLAAAAPFGGMSLQEALQAARQSYAADSRG